MKEQNYKNHAKLTPIYHIVLFVLVVADLFLAVMNFSHYYKYHEAIGWINPTLLLLIAVTVTLHGYITRLFSAQLQDRIIITEENFRHHLLTSRLLPDGLTAKQIIALRFAPDEELPSLAQKAVSEKLSNNEIKQQIKNWRADHNRI